MSSSTMEHRPLQASRANQGSSNHADRAFENMLPEIRCYALTCFKHLDCAAREEAVQEAIAHALITYRRLVELGKQDIAYAGVLARCGVLRAKSGRKAGTQQNGKDALSQRSVPVQRLDYLDDDGGWKQIAVEDRRAGPAEVASLRVDFSAWLKMQQEQDRQIAESLAVGHTPGELARQFSVSRARISQLRRALRESWNTFQGEKEPVPAVA